MKVINWQVVSERMGSTRSRLQCSYKWNHLKNVDRVYYLNVMRRLQKGKGLKSKGERKSESWRLKRAYRKLKNMKTGDRYDFLQVFAECTAPNEHSIPWPNLGNAELRQRWSTWDLKAALGVFKKEVSGSENMNYQDIVNQLYTRLLTENPGGLGDRWDPNVHGDVNELEKNEKESSREPAEQNSSSGDRVRRQESRRLRTQQNSGKKSKIKSKAFIKSDDETDTEKHHSHDNKASEEYLNRHEDNSTPNVAESAEKDMYRCKGAEVGDSSNERMDEQQRQDTSISTTDDEEEAAANASDTVRATPLGNEASETSDSDSDDSLFNDTTNASSDHNATLATSCDTKASEKSESDSDDSSFNDKQ